MTQLDRIEETQSALTAELTTLRINHAVLTSRVGVIEAHIVSRNESRTHWLRWAVGMVAALGLVFVTAWAGAALAAH